MSLRRLLGPIRALLIVAGVALFAAGLDAIASMPPAPPDSDGFVEGLAYAFSLILGVAGLLVVQVGYALPAGTGRFRVGPLADRSAGIRGGVAVAIYFVTAGLLVYGVPAVVPSVTESTTYAIGLFALVIAGLVGSVLALLFALAGLLVRTYRRRVGDQTARPP